MVELHRGLPGPGLGNLGVDIDQVARGYTRDERAKQRGPESVCGGDNSEDAVCYKSTYPSYTRRRRRWPGC